MPNQHHESHHKICNLRYRTHGYGMSAYWVTTEINLYSHHNLSSTSLNEFS